ncbi:MAG TPA: energy transducer TonB [Puia sp.]
MNYHILISLGISIFLSGSCQKVLIHNQIATPAPSPAADSTANEDQADITLETGMEVSFKGGRTAWLAFLRKNCRYPKAAIDAGISGRVPVRFTIEINGTLSDVQALEGPDILQREAVRVINLSSGQWQPAGEWGNLVKAYKIQPFIFKLEEDDD